MEEKIEQLRVEVKEKAGEVKTKVNDTVVKTLPSAAPPAPANP